MRFVEALALPVSVGLPVMVLVCSLILLRARPLFQRFFGAGALALSTAIATVGSTMALVLRDGLGPDAIESHGAIAVGRVAEGAWPFWAIAACVTVGSLSVLRWLSNKALQPTRAADSNGQREPAGSGPRG
jgi:hypothetical protein